MKLVTNNPHFTLKKISQRNIIQNPKTFIYNEYAKENNFLPQNLYTQKLVTIWWFCFNQMDQIVAKNLHSKAYEGYTQARSHKFHAQKIPNTLWSGRVV